jgi:opacity protein-like surface antigen
MHMRAVTAAAAFGLALAAILSGEAHAIDGSPRAALPPEIPPAPYNWNGPFFGTSIGLSTGQSRQTAATGDITPNFDVSGGVFGLALGYNWQPMPTLLYGIDTDVSISTQRGTSGYLGAPAGFQAETSERWMATYRGRLGYVFSSWMVYATAGGATADVKIIATEPGAGIANEDKTRWGWTAGVGVEAARLHSFTVKMEYLYADFGHPSYFSPPPGPFINRAGGVRFDDHILRIGLNHKFAGF